MAVKGDAKVRKTAQSEFFQNVASSSSYSPKGDYFVHLSLAIDNHRLRVYDTSTGKSIAEHTAESSRITAIAWQEIDDDLVMDDAGEGAHSKKKRKKSRSANTTSQHPIQVLALGMSTGMLLLFAPSRNQVIHTTPKPLTVGGAPILSIAASSSRSSVVWLSSADGNIRAWNVRTAKVVGAWQDPDRVPYTCISIRPSEEDGETSVLAGHHTIRLLSTATEKPTILTTFTGHASPITALEWDPSSSSRFVSSAEDDRIVQVWQLHPTSEDEGRLVATIALDSDVRGLAFSSKSSSISQQTLLALSSSGVVCLHALPSSLSTSTSRIPTLDAQSSISVSLGTSEQGSIVAAHFMDALPGHINVARIVSMRPTFQTIKYIEDDGKFISVVKIDPESANRTTLDADGEATESRARYSDRTADIGSGTQLAQDPSFDDRDLTAIGGDLDVDLAELTLGQRLKAITPQVNGTPTARPVMTVVTMTRTLTQALHSNDAQLMETCLTTSDERTIRGTVQDLRQDLVVPLLDTLVDRLGRGGSGNVGGASTEHATTIVTWLRVVLFAHASFLLTNPDLVARLAALHAALTARSALQDRLQMLNGRLDLVFSQVRMRGGPKDAYGGGKANGVSRALQYVEGDSSAEEDEGGMDVDVEEDDDGGSIQDVELGSDSDEGGRFNGDDDDESDESESGSDAFLIDDEAEESEGDGSEEDDEDDDMS